MTPRHRDDPSTHALHDLLLQLDLATEVLEGLDELGVDNRADLEALLVRLERQIADAEATGPTDPPIRGHRGFV
jgi:hypothetical protein